MPNLLPNERSYTLGPDDFIPSDLLDEIQDVIKEYFGERVYQVPPLTGAGSGWAWDSATGSLLSSGAGTWKIGIPLLPRRTITKITFELTGDGAADLTGNIYRREVNTAAPGVSFGINEANHGIGYTDIECDLTSLAWDIVEGDTVWIELVASAANLQVGEIRVTDRAT